MPTALVIVESPAKAKTIKRYLGSDYSVEASVGHIRDIIQPKDVKNDKRYNQSFHSENNELHSFGIDISGQADPDNDWEPWYVVSGNSRKTIAKLRKALKAVDILYLATDEDREGEAIAWHLVEVLKPKIPYFRMVFHEITEKAIVAALENTREIDMNLVAAQEARRIMDRMSGFGWSGIMRLVRGGGATGGRVQSPTTRRLVERERERIRFVSADYCSLSANVLSNEEAAFTAKLIEIDGRKVVSGKSDFDENGELKKSNEVLVLREEHAGSL
ncbi:MAG: toprim domain-containing protein, partial [Actinomycetota bacterium]|nr:toprim domain-containing protein [Actinomycetota bacterium]